MIPPVVPEVPSEQSVTGLDGVQDILPPVFHCNVLPATPTPQQLSGVSGAPLFPPLTAAQHSQCYPVTTPPPPAWSDTPCSESHGRDNRDTDSESMPSSTHSSVLVDMGKVVGVLRTYPHEQDVDDLGDENDGF